VQHFGSWALGFTIEAVDRQIAVRVEACADWGTSRGVRGQTVLWAKERDQRANGAQCVDGRDDGTRDRTGTCDQTDALPGE
jgi:hypothetical protein